MLSSFLLSQSAKKGHRNKVDNDLDTIFATSAKSANLPRNQAVAVDATEVFPKVPKRKARDETSDGAKAAKKRKRVAESESAETLEHETDQEGHSKLAAIEEASSKKKKHRGKDKERKSKGLNQAVDSLEAQYASQTIDEIPPKMKRRDEALEPPSTTRPAITPSQPTREVDHDIGSDEDETVSDLIHESLKGHVGTEKKRRFYVPEGETRAQRDERTVFIGNLPSDILKSKPLQKALKRFILSFTPTPPNLGTRIESIRYRSVAFKTPTNLQALKEKSTPTASAKKQERASAWRIGKEDDAEDGQGSNKKAYLTPAEKKRVAFIKAEFHDEAASVNAYAVFAHHDPTNPSSKAHPQLIDPGEAAALVTDRMNGAQFNGFTLRVDRVGISEDKREESTMRDPASTLFVGNLEFTAKEEDLRTFFETLLTAEMGPPGEANEDEDEVNAGQSPQWVLSVRIIRDKDTQLGKGFGYVRFSERTCVDEVVNMETTKLKFAKRKLRVSRCKTSGDKAKDPKIKAPTRTSGNAISSTKGAIQQAKGPKPKGDPKLGERLQGLSKEERKTAKKNDANRLARRMEKKKARITLEKGMRKPEKERVRVRKAVSVKAVGKKARPSKRMTT